MTEHHEVMTNHDKRDEANPHPESSHRKPGQIAADERGPTGPRPAQTRPVREVDPAQHLDAETRGDTERRNAVKRSAQKSAVAAKRAVAQRGQSQHGAAGAKPPGDAKVDRAAPGRTQ